jgi:hypothetical protein
MSLALNEAYPHPPTCSSHHASAASTTPSAASIAHTVVMPLLLSARLATVRPRRLRYSPRNANASSSYRPLPAPFAEGGRAAQTGSLYVCLREGCQGLHPDRASTHTPVQGQLRDDLQRLHPGHLAVWCQVKQDPMSERGDDRRLGGTAPAPQAQQRARRGPPLNPAQPTPSKSTHRIIMYPMSPDAKSAR